VLGYLPQDFGVYPHLTAPEFLAYLAAVKGLSPRPARSRINELLDLVNLTDVRRRPLGKFSGGMRQRIGIAQALLNDPRLLIVDEPTVGLDPEERMRFGNLLAELAADRVIILSTHIVSDVEAVADRIAVMAGGQIKRLDTADRLLRDMAGSVWETLVASADLPSFRERYLTSRAVHTPDGVRVRVLDSVVPAAGAVPVEPELEDAYLWVVRGRDRVAATVEGRTV
jgi:ABC-2 type transport system ATP-binding protein